MSDIKNLNHLTSHGLKVIVRGLHSQLLEAEAQLATAKAEIESIKTHHRYDLGEFRKCQDENKRLRETLEKIAAGVDDFQYARSALDGGKA